MLIRSFRRVPAAAVALGLLGPAALVPSAVPSATPPAPIVSPVCRPFARTGTADDAATSALPDGSVWYADRSGNRLVRIARDRTQTPFVPTDGATGRLSGVALGPDGNVWYAKDTANRLGRIPPQGGAGLEFEAPEKNSFPGGLVADRRGQLWFYSPVRNYLGRLGTDGSVVVHRGPKAGSRDFRPKGMALGPDGNLWTTDHGHNAIYRFDVGSGAFTRFDIATPTAHPDAIAAGADGNLWFTMSAARSVGRITPQGVITEFPLGDLGGGAPKGIVGTADGSVWVTTSGRSAVRIRPDGTLQTFACGQGLGTALVGPDGAPWFLDGSRVWVVEEAGTPRPLQPAAAAPVAAPWPTAAPTAAPAKPSPFEQLTMAQVVERLKASGGRVIVHFTSYDANCTYCIPSNPRLDEIATRRAKDAAFWRVTYEPWRSMGDDPFFRASGLTGLPAIVAFQDGTETWRTVGHRPEEDIEAGMFGAL